MSDYDPFATRRELEATSPPRTDPGGEEPGYWLGPAGQWMERALRAEAHVERLVAALRRHRVVP
jgi:hypothetical protein